MVKAKSTEKAPVSKAGEKEMSEKANVDAAAAASASEPEKVDAEEPMVVSGGEETKEDNNNNGEAKTEEKVEKNPTKKANKPRKRNKKRKALGDASAGAAKDGDKPEASDKKKAPNKAESMGMVFMCSSKTKKDCYRYKVLGLPAGKKEMVAKIYQGMRLFLFDIDLKLMYGIYKAAGPGGYNIEPQAFKSAFPSQVRFNVLQDCAPLPEEKFKKVIKENYYGKNKFNGQLNSEQVKNLCKLFRHASNAKSNRGADPPTRAGPRRFVDRDRNRPQRQDRVRPIIYAPPVAPPSYAYERPSEMDYYRRTTELEQRERLLEMELRRRDEIEIRDSYGAYREPPPPAYHAPLYDRPYSASLASVYPPPPPPPTSLYRL